MNPPLAWDAVMFPPGTSGTAAAPAAPAAAGHGGVGTGGGFIRQEGAPPEPAEATANLGGADIGGAVGVGGAGGGGVGAGAGGGAVGARRIFRGRDRSQRLSDEYSTLSRPRLVGGAALEEGDEEDDDGGEEEAAAGGGESSAAREMPPGEACFEVGYSGRGLAVG